MKVLLVNKYFFRNGGSEVVLFQERDFLQQAGFDVIDFSMADPRNLPSPYSSTFVRSRDYSNGKEHGVFRRLGAALALIHSPEAVRNIRLLIDQERPDIVHCHNIYHQLTPSIIGAAKRRGIPVALTLHDYKTVCPVYVCLSNDRICSECVDGGFSRVVMNRCAGGGGRSALLFAEAMVQRAMRNYEMADVLLAPSNFLRDMVTRHRFPASRVRVLYNGIDVATVLPARKDEGYVLYLGRLSAEKGIRTLLHAYAGLAAKFPLVVAGTGPLENALRTECFQAQFLGHVTGEPLRKVLQEAAVVVVPSEWYENCPMTVLEAMAYGKPVIASRIGGIPELVVNGETGLLFEPGDTNMLRDHMVLLMENESMRQELGMAGRRRVERRFSLDKHNRDLMAIYNTLTYGTSNE